MADIKSYKTPMLYTLIASIVIGAVYGISIVLRGTWDWFEMQVMTTAGIVALTSVAALGCEVSKTPLGRNLMPKFGQLLSVVAGLMTLVSTWAILESLALWKFNVSVSILAVAVVHLSLLSVAKLSNRFRWLYPLAMQVIFGLASLLIGMLVLDWYEGGIWQLVAVLAIIDAALTIVIPICHRIDRLSTNQNRNLMPLAEHSVVSIDEELIKLRLRISKLEKLRLQIAGNSNDAFPGMRDYTAQNI